MIICICVEYYNIAKRVNNLLFQSPAAFLGLLADLGTNRDLLLILKLLPGCWRLFYILLEQKVHHFSRG